MVATSIALILEYFRIYSSLAFTGARKDLHSCAGSYYFSGNDQ